jgi:glycosyltransferase involved in cell wall biosynthesis
MTQKKPLSIIYLHNQRLMGGKAHDIVIMRTCYALARSGHCVKIITGPPLRGDTIFSYYGLHPIPEFEVIRIPMVRGRTFSWHAVFNFFCLLKLFSLRRKGMADIIYLREIKLARFLLKFRRFLRLPFVIEVHDLKIKKFYDSCPEKEKSEDYVFHRVHGIVVLLNVFGDILKETYRVSGIPVVKVPLAAGKAPFPEHQNGHKTVGYVGQLYPAQGVDVLVTAMRFLPDARLSIIGGREKDLKRLKNLAATMYLNERIDFHGFVNPHRVPEIARDADVMVICALNRGKRRYSAHTKLYEYMAMGKPIVAVDLPSIREEVTDGKDILLANPEDPQDLAEKITSVLNNRNLAETLALNAYQTADEFSWEKRADRLADFFSTVYEDYQSP